jgi:hypothetical protein
VQLDLFGEHEEVQAEGQLEVQEVHDERVLLLFGLHCVLFHFPQGVLDFLGVLAQLDCLDLQLAQHGCHSAVYLGSPLVVRDHAVQNSAQGLQVGLFLLCVVLRTKQLNDPSDVFRFELLVEQNNEHLEFVDWNGSTVFFSFDGAGVVAAEFEQELQIAVGLDTLVEGVQGVSLS